MLSGWLVALSMAVSPGQCATCGPMDGGMMGGGMAFSPGMTAGSWSAGMGGFGNPYDSVSMGGGGGGDQLYPFDSPEPWLWGHFQEIPAYGGYASFRPHNYKHVLAQMDVAGRWGISPTMPYSHQWYHRYRQRGGMHPNYGTPYVANDVPGYGDIAASDPGASSASDRFYRTEHGDESLIQAAAMERGYSGTPIPGISVPDYQFARVPEGRDTLSDEYLSRIDQMQQRIDQQNYQMQVLQQQLQNSAGRNVAAFPPGQPQYPGAGSNQQYSAPNAYAQSGYQELPPPAAYQYPAQVNTPTNAPLMVPQQGFSQAGYPQTSAASGYQQFGQSSATEYVPAEMYQQPAGATFVPQQFSPQFSQPTASPPVYGAPTGQPGFAAPQTNWNAAGAAVPYQSSQFAQPGQFSQPGAWQQPAPQAGLVPMGQAGPANAQAYGYGASQPGGYFVPSGPVGGGYGQQPGMPPASVPYAGGNFAR